MSEAGESLVLLGDVADTNPEALPGNTPGNARFRYIDLSAVEAGFINWDAVVETTFSVAPSRARRIVKPFDALFGTVRPNLQSHGFIRADESGPLIASTGFSVIRARDGVSHPGYLFHSILSSQVAAQAVRNAIGSSYPAVNDTDVKRFQIFLPAFREQELIAQVLDTLDTAIRETEALIDKLKAVKQGLLHDLLTRGIDANGQLRPPQSEAPQLYKESPLGWIPGEWSWGTLGHWLTGKPKNGYSPQEAGEWTGVQMLGLGCLTKEGFFPVQLKPAPAGDKGLEKALLSDGDLLISRANTRELVGLVGVYRDVGTPCTYPDLMMRLMPSEETSAEFLQLILQSNRVRRQIQAAASGTSESMVKISSSVVAGLKVAIPKSDEQGIILCRTKALDGQLQSELQGLEVLRSIKVGLMDDLLTGRVRITPLLESVQQAAAQTGA